MYPARGEPGRNGDHRPLEFSDVIIGCRGILHLDYSETCLTRHLRVAGSARQAHRINRLAPKAQTAGIDLTIRPSGMGQESRAVSEADPEISASFFRLGNFPVPSPRRFGAVHAEASPEVLD